LKLVLIAIRSTSDFKAWNSRSVKLRSRSPTVSEADWMANSRRRIRMFVTSLSPPSETWIKETPSWAFRLACLRPRTCALRFSEIASPAASSPAVLIRLPEASLSMFLLSEARVPFKLRWATSEEIFVLTLSPILSIHNKRPP